MAIPVLHLGWDDLDLESSLYQLDVTGATFCPGEIAGIGPHGIIFPFSGYISFHHPVVFEHGRGRWHVAVACPAIEFIPREDFSPPPQLMFELSCSAIEIQ